MQHNNGKAHIPLLSFFTGGGFLDMGFEDAGFKVVFTNEIDKDFALFYKEGMTSWSGETKEIDFIGSIEDVSPENIKNYLDSPFWGIIGGPPCQDFSIRGSKAGFDGIRGTQTYHFHEKVMGLKPSFFLMENVPGLVLLKKTKNKFFKIIELFEKEYVVSKKKLNALHYGVPQFRERYFVLGIRRDCFNELPLNPLDDSWFPWPAPIYPRAEKMFSWGEPPSRQSNNKNEDWMPPPSKLCVSSILIEEDEYENIPNANEYFKLKRLDKVNQIEEGDTYRPSFKKLHRSKYSPTACYGNNEVHLHPVIPRRLSVRESLRIQGVSDNYIISTKGNLTKKFKMIGNGVPVLLASSIAKSIESFLGSLIDKEELYGYLDLQKTKRGNVENPVQEH